MTSENPDGSRNEIHPAPAPHPFANPGAPFGASPYAAGDHGRPNAWPAASFSAPPPEPPRRRGWFFYAMWIAAGVLVVGLLLLGTALAVTAVSDFAEEASASVAEQRGTVLSESWNVDGVDVVYVEAGGAPCRNEFCWEWLLMTQPDCPTATVTVEISKDLFGEAQRRVDRSVTIERVTSVLVEAEESDGDYADITSISCN